MYHTPNLTGLRKKYIPKRINEGWGLQHMKLYGTDDEIIISGYSNSFSLTSHYQKLTICQSKPLRRLLHKSTGSLPRILFQRNNPILLHNPRHSLQTQFPSNARPANPRWIHPRMAILKPRPLALNLTKYLHLQRHKSPHPTPSPPFKFSNPDDNNKHNSLPPSPIHTSPPPRHLHRTSPHHLPPRNPLPPRLQRKQLDLHSRILQPLSAPQQPPALHVLREKRGDHR